MSSTTLMKTMAVDIALVSPKMVAAFGIAVVVILLKKFMFLDKKKRNKKKWVKSVNATLLYSTHLSFIFFWRFEKRANLQFWLLKEMILRQWNISYSSCVIYALRWRCPVMETIFFFIFFFWWKFFSYILFVTVFSLRSDTGLKLCLYPMYVCIYCMKEKNLL